MPALPPLKRPLGDKPESSYTLSSAYYLDQGLFELEKEQIFYRSWQYVAHETMLPEHGDYMTLKICDENLFVIRSSDGCLRAFYNICRHRAHELLQGQGNVGKLIVCPYHAWSYNSQGGLMQAPMSEHRPGFVARDFCLREIRLELFCGFIFVNLDPEAEPLGLIAADLEQDIRSSVPYLDQLDYCGSDMLGETRVEAGWKVVVDNYVECYHCRSAHPDFASVIKMDSYQTTIHGLWSKQRGPDIRHENSAYPVDPQVGMQESLFWYLWPNTTFNIMPGSNEMGVFVVRPLDAGASDFGGHSFASGGAPYQPRVDYTAAVLAPEDIRLCESVQRGLKSRSYDQGAYMVDPLRPGESEHALHQFHRLVYQALAGH